MTKMKKQRKGFTLTELAIVIAVIAILIAVLVPTFISLINKAKESNDTQMIYEINLALSAETDIETPEDALDVAAETGYNIDKLTPSSDGDIVYDELTKSFALVSDNAVVYPTSNSSLDLSAATTWYFASNQDDIKSETASYIITGTWNSDVVYEGTGQIDTSRATVYGGVIVGVDTTNNTGYVGTKGSLATKKLTADGNSTKTIILNIVSGYAIYIYPTSDMKYVIYSDADFNFSKEVSTDTYSVARGSGELNENITYITATEESKSSGLAIAGQIISEICTQSDATNTVSFVLQLGTEKYPYLLSTADDVVAIQSKVSVSRKVYFKLNENIDMADVTGTQYYGKLMYECELDLSGYTIKAAEAAQVLIVSTGSNAVIKDSSSAGSGAIYVEGSNGTIQQLISMTAKDAKLTLESGSLYAKDATLTKGVAVVNLKGQNASGLQFIMKGGSIYAKNSTINSLLNVDYKGTITMANGSLYAEDSTLLYGIVSLQAKNTSTAYATFEMNGGSISADENAVTLYSTKASGLPNVTINDGTIKAGDYCIAGYGENVGSSTITINGGNLTSTTDYAIYNPQKGTVIISGGTISGGAGAVCMNKGTLNISGGELICAGEGNTGDASDGTGNLENAVINLGAQYAAVTCTITNCTLTAKTSKTYVITVGSDAGAKYSVTLTVTDATITKNGSTVSDYITTNGSFTTSIENGATVYTPAL